MNSMGSIGLDTALFEFEGPTPIPFSKAQKLKFYPNPNGGIVFSQNNNINSIYKPTLRNVEEFSPGNIPGKIKTFSSTPPNSRYTFFEHILATLYVTGFHNIRVDFTSESTKVYGLMPPQPSNREIPLTELLRSKQREFAVPFERSISLPPYSSPQNEKISFQTSPLENELEVECEVDWKGVKKKCRKNLSVGSIEEYLDIADSRPYSWFKKLSWAFPTFNNYTLCETPEEIEEAAKHAIVDRLGAIALLANTLDAQILGLLSTFLSGHKTDLFHLNEIYKILKST